MKKLTRMLTVMLLAACLCVGLSVATFADCHGDASYASITKGETLVVATDHGVNLRSLPKATSQTLIKALPEGPMCMSWQIPSKTIRDGSM